MSCALRSAQSRFCDLDFSVEERAEQLQAFGGIAGFEQAEGVEWGEARQGCCLEGADARVAVERERGVGHGIAQFRTQRQEAAESFYDGLAYTRRVFRGRRLVEDLDIGPRMRIVGKPPLYPEAFASDGFEEPAAVGQLPGLHDLGHGPEFEAFVSAPDLLAPLDEYHAEAAIAFEATVGEHPVTLLEDVERDELVGEQHRPQGEHREPTDVAHAGWSRWMLPDRWRR